MLANFKFMSNRQLIFGAGTLANLPEIAQKFCWQRKQGRQSGKLLIVQGQHFAESEHADHLKTGLKKEKIDFSEAVISSEPSAQIIDEISNNFRGENVGAVLAVGGGSVLDGGKAVAAMLCHEGSVECYLEGVGTEKPKGKCVPVIAVPTTAGTGSEATKNAVITHRFEGGVSWATYSSSTKKSEKSLEVPGQRQQTELNAEASAAGSSRAYKKSLRHDAYIPEVVIIDAELAVGCPYSVTMACGLDALCQLMEAWLSAAAGPFTDMVAIEGLRNFSLGAGFLDGDGYGGGEEVVLRGYLGMAAYCSGLALANAGLGTVHGIAGPLGAYCPVPHGLACGRLMPSVFRKMQRYFLDDPEANTNYLGKLQQASSIILGLKEPQPIAAFIKKIENWSAKLPMITAPAQNILATIATKSSNKNSPVNFREEERLAILLEALE